MPVHNNRRGNNITDTIFINYIFPYVWRVFNCRDVINTYILSLSNVKFVICNEHSVYFHVKLLLSTQNSIVCDVLKFRDMCAERSEILAYDDDLGVVNDCTYPASSRGKQQHTRRSSSSSFSVCSVSRSASTFGNHLIRDVLCSYPDQPLLYSLDRLLNTLGGQPRTQVNREPSGACLLYERSIEVDFVDSSPDTSPSVRSLGELLKDDRPRSTTDAAMNQMDTQNQDSRRSDSDESDRKIKTFSSSNEAPVKIVKTSISPTPSKTNPVAMTSSDRSIAREIWTVILENVLDEIQSRYDMHLNIEAHARSSIRPRAEGLPVTSRQVDSIVSDVMDVLRVKSEVDLKKSLKVIVTSKKSARSKSAIVIGDSGDIILNSRILSSIINKVLDTTDTLNIPNVDSAEGKSSEGRINWMENTLLAVVEDVVRDRISKRTELKRCMNSTRLHASDPSSSATTDEKEIMVEQITNSVLSRIISKSTCKIDGQSVVSVLQYSLKSNHPSVALSVYYDGGMLIDMQSLAKCVDTLLNHHASRKRVISPGSRSMPPSILKNRPLYQLREIEVPHPQRPARLVQQQYTIARINIYDDDSQIVEVVRPEDAQSVNAWLMQDARATGDDGRNLDALFAVLPDRTAVCFTPCDRIKLKT